MLASHYTPEDLKDVQTKIVVQIDMDTACGWNVPGHVLIGLTLRLDDGFLCPVAKKRLAAVRGSLGAEESRGA